jgi:hypothetical protein
MYINMRQMQRETEIWGVSEGQYILGRGGPSNFLALKVPRQCPFKGGWSVRMWTLL